MRELLTELTEQAARNPQQPAVTYVSDFTDLTSTVRNRSELDLHSRRIASWLRERFSSGDRALLLYSPGIEFTTAFSACVYAGVIAVPAPLPGRYRHERRRLAAIARDAGVRVVLTQRGDLPDVEKWVAEEGILGAVCHTTDTGEGDPDAWTAPEVSPDTLALLQYTSGSTGDPKGVMVTHGNLVANVERMAAMFRNDGDTTYGGWIPLYHDMGLIGLMLPGLLNGNGYVQMDPMSFLRRPYHWLRMLDACGIGFTAAPDFGYEMCVRRVTDEQLAALDLSRVMFSDGSEPVRHEVVTAFTERFSAAGLRPEALVPAYGLAEATLMVSGTGGRPPLRTTVDATALENREFRPATGTQPSRTLVGCGSPTGSDVLIVDPDTGRALPEGRVGEIWLSGPCVTAGYWKNGPVTDATFRAHTDDGRGPFLRTGDLGALLDDDLYITGRSKDVLVLHGRNLHPSDIECELRSQHEELEGLHGAVFMVGDDGGADVTPAVVVVHEIRAHWGAERLGSIAVDMKQTVVREFGVPVTAVALVRPGGVRRTTSGKVQRAAMRALHLAGELDTLHLREDPLLTDALAGQRRRVSGR
ncbi:fatty acyl-AMP ligase [Streptomyces scabiei]|uniref:fatty acyl-AMP ligase n=2 Tax=Streptomyces scabiei TaxID=1930 RepID=UPI0029A4C95B|nr:fatty acyl-AMP ligase [Streptomyces scabiei]MDX2687315.1 fatty acyl-AMP ligase [Streptomyces scabiei]MDX2751090.1 fatty acyl-AMP ligase [Streptomyces scabiei]MDX2809136.1 fatty acyl-AMP ligase [Streptomyces scabiei]MDX3123406.1 fatty acyl-AMP ligase [Streptomyces scabiei]MDX3202620.1 fatty acyl-AMP ligase [Streptomyces scabiei]